MCKTILIFLRRNLYLFKLKRCKKIYIRNISNLLIPKVFIENFVELVLFYLESFVLINF